MKTKERTIEALADEAYYHFERKTVGEREIYVRKDDAPEWIETLVYDAHGDLLPEDWRYSMIVNALEAISLDGEEAEIEADAYANDLLRWLSSNTTRLEYVTQAMQEYEAKDAFTALHMGQWIELNEVIQSVLVSLQARLEEIEAE